MIEYLNINNTKIAVISDGAIGNLNDVLDMMGTVFFEGCDKMIAPKEAFTDDFFKLRTGIAGEILQKFSNYGMRLAIVGDFKNVQSKALRDFIYECNKGNQVFFKTTQEAAVAALTLE